MINFLRSFRFLDIALFDLIMSVVALIMILVITLPRDHGTHFYVGWALILVLPISILAHIIFRVPTALNHYLGLSDAPVRNM